MNSASEPRPGRAPNCAAAIRYCAVAKRYRGRSVLRNVSFAVPANSSTAIVGLNGVGKSTLLRCLLDFTRPDEGQILIGSRDHGDIRARTELAWLPERFVPPSHLTARECLRWFGLRGCDLDAEQLAAAAERLGLANGVLDRRVGELSKGMSQKLGLISISLSQCPIWVLDEPMSGLDPQARRDISVLFSTGPGGPGEPCYLPRMNCATCRRFATMWWYCMRARCALPERPPNWARATSMRAPMARPHRRRLRTWRRRFWPASGNGVRASAQCVPMWTRNPHHDGGQEESIDGSADPNAGGRGGALRPGRQRNLGKLRDAAPAADAQ